MRSSPLVQTSRLRQLAIAGLIAALYVVISVGFLPISFGVYQIRVAEALTVLPFITPAAVPGLFVGCLLANIFGGMGWQDIVFGSLLTLIAALATRWIASLNPRRALLIPVFLPLLLFWAASVYLLEGNNPSLATPVCIIASVALLLFSIYWENRAPGRELVGLALRIISFLATILLLFLLRERMQGTDFLLGGLALMGAWVCTWGFAVVVVRKLPANMLLAPLPPVLLNAFGVSLYLAPLMGVSYWFAVQMIGIGELIACYLIGLPLLGLLHKRSDLF